MSSPELTPNSIPPELNVERLSRSALRFESTIAAGIKRARDRKQEIDDETGTLIAHVLGRGLGRDSDLAEFARTQTADPAKIEQECSAIYGNPSTPLGRVDQV